MGTLLFHSRRMQLESVKNETLVFNLPRLLPEQRLCITFSYYDFELGNTQILLLERDNNETQTHKRPSLRTHIRASINTVWHLRNSHIKSSLNFLQ